MDMDSAGQEAHEAAFIGAFVAPSRRERLLYLATRTKKRQKFRAELAHFRSFDERYAFKIESRHQSPDEIYASLVAKGAPPDCYVLSEDPDLDGQCLRLDQVLSRVVGEGYGTFISCVPGRLGYYEGEEAKERYLLVR